VLLHALPKKLAHDPEILFGGTRVLALYMPLAILRPLKIKDPPGASFGAPGAAGRWVFTKRVQEGVFADLEKAPPPPDALLNGP
jgi:hypothetical protein